MVEHSLDVRRVSGSSPLTSTKEWQHIFVLLFFYVRINMKNGLEPQSISHLCREGHKNRRRLDAVKRTKRSFESVNVHQRTVAHFCVAVFYVRINMKNGLEPQSISRLCREGHKIGGGLTQSSKRSEASSPLTSTKEQQHIFVLLFFLLYNKS